MNGSKLKQSLHDGRRVYGTLIVSDSPRWLQHIPSIGLDFIFLDTEHLPLDRQRLSWMCHAYAGLGLTPVVRISSPDPHLATMAIDGGAQGIIVPYTESPDQVRKMAGAVHLRPLKGELLAKANYDSNNLQTPLNNYLQRYNANNLLIVNIESIPAMENLDDILSIPGLDAVLIGPHDLSISLGIPEEYNNPYFLQAVDTIIQKARSRGIGAGIHATYPDALQHEIRWAQMGANLIIHRADFLVFRDAMQQDLNTLRNILGDSISTATSESTDI